MRYFLLIIAFLTSIIATSQNLQEEEQTGLNSASTLDASGGEASGSGGSASFSIGQVFFTSNYSADYSVSEGVQQPTHKKPETFKPIEEKLPIKITAYPNPMTEFLIIEVENLEDRKLNYELLDLHGRLLELNPLQGTKTKITPRNLQTAVYLLRVTEHGKPIKTLRIIKN